MKTWARYLILLLLETHVDAMITPAPNTRGLMKSVWLLLKTLLFSTIMVADEVLGSVVFAKPRLPKHQDMPHATARSLAETVLRTLFHISFVVSQFGGVTATATSEDPGFREMRKVFYLAIDIFSSGEPLRGETFEQGEVCERFVRELIDDLGSSLGMFSFLFCFASVLTIRHSLRYTNEGQSKPL